MSRDLPRRPGSSRNPTSRPRRIAGRGSAPGPTPEAEPEGVTTEVETEDVTEPTKPVEPRKGVEPHETVEPDDAAIEPDDAAIEPDELVKLDEDERTHRDLGSLFASRRTTTVLVAVAAVLALVAAGLGIWLWQHDEDPAAGAPPDEGAISVPDGRPVMISAKDAQEATAAAAEAATTIVATSYEDYDEQVDEAAALMTDKFAAEYRQTAEDVKQELVESKTEVEVRIVAQGVVRANTAEVQALLFLNQYSSKDGGDTTYTPYRALVTVVHTDTGWLVSGLDTK